jgi:outer membrane protein OmpA-like peptidoglycan-associated protein
LLAQGTVHEQEAIMKEISAIVLGAVMLACATEPSLPPNPELASARSTYQLAAADPVLQAEAPARLSEAAQLLLSTEAAWKEGADPREVAALAYLVERRVLIARWVAGRSPGEADPAKVFVVHAPKGHGDLADLQARHLEAEQRENGLVVTLGRTLFEGSPNELTEVGAWMVDRVADFLAQYPERRVAVEGHTDNMGSNSYNQRVSEERANAVARRLQARGVGQDQVSATGFGAGLLRFGNTSRAGRRLNRRVEIVIENPGSRGTRSVSQMGATGSGMLV